MSGYIGPTLHDWMGRTVYADVADETWAPHSAADEAPTVDPPPLRDLVGFDPPTPRHWQPSVDAQTMLDAAAVYAARGDHNAAAWCRRAARALDGDPWQAGPYAARLPQARALIAAAAREDAA